MSLSDCIRMICAKVLEENDSAAAIPNSTLAMVALVCKDARNYFRTHFPKNRLCILSPHDITRFDGNVIGVMKTLRQDLYDCAISVVLGMGTKTTSRETSTNKLMANVIMRNAQPVAMVQGSLQHAFWNKLDISELVEEAVGECSNRTIIYKQRFVVKDTLWISPTLDTQGAYVDMKEGRTARPYRVKRSQFRQILVDRINAVIDGGLPGLAQQQERKTALAMALHERLGAKSGISSLGGDLVVEVVKWI